MNAAKTKNRINLFKADLAILLPGCALVFLFSLLLLSCDQPFHLDRLRALAEQIRQTGLLQYPHFVNFSSNEGMGYATPTFYGDLLLLPAALLICLGMPLRWAYALTAAVCMFASWASMCQALRAFYPDAEPSRCSAAALVYALSNYLLFETVERSSMGAVLLFPVIPWLFVSFFQILNGTDELHQKRICLRLAVSLGLVLVTHLQSAVIITLFLFLAAFLNPRRLFRKRTFLRFAGAAAAFFTLTVWFWAPMLEQMAWQPLFVTSSDISMGKYPLASGMIAWPTILFPNYVYAWLIEHLNAWFGLSLSLPTGSTWSFTIPAWWWAGRLLFAVVAVRALYSRRPVHPFVTRICVPFLVVCFPFSFTTWFCIQRLFGFMQFPWRIMLLFTVLLPLVLMETPVLVRPDWDKIILRVLAAAGAATYLVAFAILLQRGAPVNASSIGQGEYLPAAFAQLLGEQDLPGRIREENSVEQVVPRGNGYEVSLQPGWETQKSLELPVVAYKGYAIYSEQGNRCGAVVASANGLVQVDADLVPASRFYLRYEGTVVQAASKWLSVAALVVLGVIWRKEKK